MQTELAEIVAAHGGLEYWRSLGSIEVEMSASGFLFPAKRVPPLRHARLTISTDRPEATIHDYPAPGLTALFHGEDRVEIRDSSGKVLQGRKNPREAFRTFRRLLYWDPLDFAYFCGYAMWNYLTMPFLFLGQGIKFNAAGSNTPDDLKRLTATFPKGFATHCEKQDFYFDQQRHLRRHDYTAEVVGSWAKASHICDGYRQFSGLSLPTRRRVYPKLLFGKSFPLVTLVAIDIHDVIPVPRSSGT